MNNSSKQHFLRKNTLIALLLAALFVGPIAAAWLVYRGHINWNVKKVNHGKLLTPPIHFEQLTLKTDNGEPLKAHAFHGKWLLLYVRSNNCNKNCEDNLYKMRQTYVALNKDSERVQRLIVTLPEYTDLTALNQLLTKQYFGTQHAFIDKAQLRLMLLETTPSTINDEGHLYIVDPLGYIMMHYQNSAAATGLLKDMKRLLKVSHIG